MDTKEDLEKYQRKSLTHVNEYKFSLSEELEALAKEELRETEEVRQHAIKALRDFVLKNPRIEMTRLDAKYLLRFLRFRKFSIPMAMEALERIMVIKQGPYGRNWLDSLDIQKPSIMKLIDKGMVFFLPERDFLGRKIVFYRPGVSDPMKPSTGYDILILMTLIFELILEDEENQIRGVVHLADARGIRPPHFTIFSPQYQFRIGKNSEKTLAMRHKSFHIVNVHKSLSIISNFIISHMSDKLKKRTHFYSSFDEFKAVEKSKLPKEYGGNVPMKEMIDSTKQELLSNRKLHMLYNNTRVNQSLYPKEVLEGSVKSLRYQLNSSELQENLKKQEILFNGIQGSFRKLEID